MLHSFGQLCHDSECDCIVLAGDRLSTGTCLEVLICRNARSKPEWVQTRLEIGQSWYLVDLPGVDVAGLWARI